MLCRELSLVSNHVYLSKPNNNYLRAKARGIFFSLLANFQISKSPYMIHTRPIFILNNSWQGHLSFLSLVREFLAFLYSPGYISFICIPIIRSRFSEVFHTPILLGVSFTGHMVTGFGLVPQSNNWFEARQSYNILKTLQFTSRGHVSQSKCNTRGTWHKNLNLSSSTYFSNAT